VRHALVDSRAILRRIGTAVKVTRRSPGYQLNAVTVVRNLQWHPEYTLSSVLVLLRLQDTQVEEVLQALIREVDTELQNQSR